MDPANRQRVEAIVQNAPQVPWHVSVHSHAAILARYLQQELGNAFPRRKRGACHAFLSDATLVVRRQLSQARHRFARLRAQVRAHMLRAAFASWAQRDRGTAFLDTLCIPWSRAAHFAAATCGWQIGRLAAKLRIGCAEDRAAYLNELAARVSSGRDGQAFQAVRRLLGHKRKKPFKVDVLPAVRNLDGSLCSTPCSVTRRWREHFSALEGGVEVSEDDLLALAMRSRQENWPSPSRLALVPAVTRLESTLKAAPSGKAPGPDGIPNGVGISSPTSMAQQMYPLALKICLRGSEPIRYKGGLLCKVFKGRGPHDQCGSFRGILLLPTQAKALHKCLRPTLAEHFERTAVQGQLSGRKGMTATFASHAMRGFFRSRLAMGESVAIVYADVSAAYYHAVRQLSSQAGQAFDLRAICKGLDILPEDFEALRRHIDAGSAMDFECAEPWLQRIATELNCETWMTIAGDGECPIATHRGSRPGSSWADLMFGLLVKRLLLRRDSILDRECEPAEEWAPTLAWDGCRSFATTASEPAAGSRQVPFGDQIWADDLATPLSSSVAARLPAKVACVAGALSDSFAEHAMELTFGPLKTAAVMGLRGEGSRAVRRQVFSQGSCGECVLAVLRENSPPAALPLVDSYRHLGVVHCYDGSLAKEIKQRVGQAWGAFREGRRKLYRNKLVHPHRRCDMLTSLVLSKLLVGAGAWPPLKLGEDRTLRGAMYAMYRSLLCLPRGGNFRLHACTLRAKLSASSPCALLHASRLRYAAQMTRSAPDHLWAVTKADRPYCDLVLGSFTWLYARIGKTTCMPDPLACWEPWRAVMTDAPGRFKGWIKRALALEKAVDVCAAEHAAFHHLCRSRAATTAPGHDSCNVDAVPEVCIPCRKGFRSKLAWASHAARVHAYRTDSTKLAQGNVCHSCGKAYANTRRLQRHLSHSAGCRSSWGKFLPADDVRAPHPQMPPTAVEGAVDCNFRGSNLDWRHALHADLNQSECDDASSVLCVVSRHFAPISDLRAAVLAWGAGFQRGRCERVAADAAADMLYPRHFCEASQSPAASTLDSEEFPILGPLTPLTFTTSGTVQCYWVGEPPDNCPSWPWQSFGTLASANALAQWVVSAFEVCASAVRAAARQPVELHFDQAALQVLPAVQGWLVEGGFSRVGCSFFSPVSLEFIC